MTTRHSSRLLSIGEFSAATQLSPKALRLYDEQGILRPAVVDAANGYRYYRNDQISNGRLIRTLRDMDLPLASVADVVSAPVEPAEALLRQFAQAAEQRLVRQKHAFQTALSLLRRARPADAPSIAQRMRATAVVAVRPFLAERCKLIERYRIELAAGLLELTESDRSPSGEPFCVLVDAISDDAGRAEVMIPIRVSAGMPSGFSVQQLPSRDCAVLATAIADPNTFDPTAALDALFDWFDRRGCHATEAPMVSFVDTDTGSHAEVMWAFESVAADGSSR